MQVKTYKTRVSVLLMSIFVIATVAPLLFALKEGKVFVVPIVLLVLVLLIGIIKIKYVIDGDTLKIYSFFWMHNDIDIKSIRKIEPNRSFACTLVSSPAASLKRLAIHYNKYDEVYVSPRNQEDFINEINKRMCKEKE